MEEVLLYVLKLNVLAAAVILLALMFSGFMKEKYSVWWRNRLWLLVSVLLLCPFPFPAAEHAVRIAVPDEFVLQPETEESTAVAEKEETARLQEEELLPDRTESGEVTSEINAPEVRTVELEWILRGAIVIWLTGVLAVFGFRLLGYRIVKKELNRWSVAEPDKELLLKYRILCREMGIRHPPGIRLNPKLTTPLLTGLFRPQLYLPSEQFTQREMELLLEHELCHYRRKDLWYQLVLQTVCTVYWWNPALWMMKRQAQKEVEFLCDEMVTKEKKKDERMQYNYLLARTAVRSRSFYGMSTGFSKDMSVLKERMVNVMKSGGRKKGTILTVCFAAVLLAANVMTGCSVKENGETEKNRTVETESVSSVSDPEQEPLSTEPVETKQPEATATPEPTTTPELTVTPESTPTPEPTETPKPTEIPEATPTPTEEETTAVQTKINVYEGEYMQEQLRSGDPDVGNKGYIVKTSNITSTSFDFSIYYFQYHFDTNQETEDLVFRKHIAVFVEDGTKAVYDGKDYDLTFTFPDQSNTYPDAVYMQISGYEPVEGLTFSNSQIPGHEFG